MAFWYKVLSLFPDFLTRGKLSADTATSLVDGFIQGCKFAGCMLIDSKTSEMSGIYPNDEYDLTHFAFSLDFPVFTPIDMR